MAAPIEFYFDFSSPYGYFASTRIDGLAARHGRTVNWHPILLGAVFKVTGGQPLPSLPLKGDYARRDIERCARLLGIPFRVPSRFPVATQAPARAVYRAYFVEDRDIASPEVTADIAAALGVAREPLLAALDDPAVKEKLKRETDTAMERGVFGSPFLIVDGEPFWGMDRFEQAEKWMATGGW